LVLGGILLAATVLFGPVTNADAQGQSQAKGKAQGQVKGQVQGADEGEGEDEAEGGAGQEKVTLCHKDKNIITVGAPALKAHLAHGDDVIDPEVASEDCGTSEPDPGPDPDPEPCLPEVFGTVDVQKGEGNTLETVEQGDEISVPVEGDFELAATGTVSITLGLGDGTGEQVTFVDGDAVADGEVAATITQQGDGTLLITVGEDVPELAVADLEGFEVVSSEGILCPEDTEEGAEEESDQEETLTGTLATTRSGDVALRTKGGKDGSKAVPLVTQTQDQEKRLEELAASKLGKVKVTGAKVKDKSAKKVKGQKQKEALKVTSVKKANKNK